MRFLHCLIAASALLLAACSSTSTTQTADAGKGAANTVASTGGDEGVVCKRVQVTGTRFTEKVCTTAAQREARARAARDAAAQVGIKAQQVGGPQGG